MRCFIPNRLQSDTPFHSKGSLGSMSIGMSGILYCVCIQSHPT